MNSTTVVAWWGAILSTVAIGWDIYKHRTAGPKLRLMVRETEFCHVPPDYKGRKFFEVTVTNSGDRPTTLTYFAFQGFKKRLFRKSTIAGESQPRILANTARLPFELTTGAVWDGKIAILTNDIEKWGTKGLAYLVLFHSHSKKPLRQHLVTGREPAASKKVA